MFYITKSSLPWLHWLFVCSPPRPPSSWGPLGWCTSSPPAPSLPPHTPAAPPAAATSSSATPAGFCPAQVWSLTAPLYQAQVTHYSRGFIHHPPCRSGVTEGNRTLYFSEVYSEGIWLPSTRSYLNFFRGRYSGPGQQQMTHFPIYAAIVITYGTAL